MIVVSLATMIAGWILNARQCKLSRTHLLSMGIVEIIQTVSTWVTLVTLIIFHFRMRPDLNGHKSIRKLVGIKLLVHLIIVQSLIFAWIKPDVSRPRKHLSFYDIKIGFPALLVCLEMLLFYIFWFWLYSPNSVVLRSSYAEPGAALPQRHVGVGYAILDALNISDTNMSLR